MIIITINERNNYLSKIARSSGINFRYSFELLKVLENIKAIKYKNDNGKIKYLYLTEKGKRLKELLLIIDKYEKKRIWNIV